MMLSRAVWAEQRSQSYVPIIKQIATTRQETADATAIKIFVLLFVFRSLLLRSVIAPAPRNDKVVRQHGPDGMVQFSLVG